MPGLLCLPSPISIIGVFFKILSAFVARVFIFVSLLICIAMPTACAAILAVRIGFSGIAILPFIDVWTFFKPGFEFADFVAWITQSQRPFTIARISQEDEPIRL